MAGSTSRRIEPDGLALRDGDDVFRVRGVTYGSFLPRGDGALYPEPAVILDDFAMMAAAGCNTVRTYTAPPADLLEAAEAHGLKVLVGLQYDDWRQHPRPGRRAHQRVLDAGRRAIDDAMQVVAGSPTVLAISVGNEVPGDVVRVHGRSRVQDGLSRLVAEVHDADPSALATYTNYPTTEYLSVAGQDVATFNVFLEDPDRLRSYLHRLQVIVGDVPVVVTELGLAGELHGDAHQAESLDAQLRAVDEVGLAGATVFAWTDDWAVAGERVEGWGFGLTDAERRPKPSLEVVRTWTARDLRSLRDTWPRISVVVCAYNEQRTIAECLGSLEALDYPDLEVILCDDGSTDATTEIAEEFTIKLVALEHGGLSAARNAGMRAASGEIIAYLDADAACHADWPYRLALSLEDPDIVATGGPNLPVPDVGFVERAIGSAPGSAQHVLTSHDRAEHVPGCNMTFRHAALEAIGGFDVDYTSAGDDTDACWKLLDRGWQIGFAPTAQVFHHRRATVAGYLRQQRGYGRAERMLSGPHRHRFNRLGQARWSGVVYGSALQRLLQPVIYHGYFGTAPYQTVQRRRGELALAVARTLLPVTLPLALVAALLSLAHVAFGLVALGLLSLPVLHAAVVAMHVRPPRDEQRPLAHRLLVGALHTLQPFARAWGRLRGRPLPVKDDAPGPWTGDRLAWLERLRVDLADHGMHTVPGEATDGWDLEVRRGPVVAVRVTTAVVWSWVPMAGLRLRLRAPVLITIGAAAIWSAIDVRAVVVLAAALLVAGVSALLQRRRVRASLARTTDGELTPRSGMRG